MIKLKGANCEDKAYGQSSKAKLPRQAPEPKLKAKADRHILDKA